MSNEMLVGQEKNYFVLVMLVPGWNVLGKVSEESYSGWLLNKCKLMINEPRNLVEQPVQENGRTVGVSLALQPFFMASTRQEIVTFEPKCVECVENLGMVKMTDGHEYLDNADKEHVELFNAWHNFGIKWRANKAGIISPTDFNKSSKNPFKLV